MKQAIVTTKLEENYEAIMLSVMLEKKLHKASAEDLEVTADGTYRQTKCLDCGLPILSWFNKDNPEKFSGWSAWLATSNSKICKGGK